MTATTNATKATNNTTKQQLDPCHRHRNRDLALKSMRYDRAIELQVSAKSQFYCNSINQEQKGDLNFVIGRIGILNIPLCVTITVNAKCNG